QVARGGVFRMMTGNECSGSEHLERMRDDDNGGFSSESHAPVTAAQLEPHFIDVHFSFTGWPQSAAADVFTRLAQEDGPVLNLVAIKGIDFASEPRHPLLIGERPAGVSTHRRVTPETQGQPRIAAAPVTESQPVRLHEI